MQNSKSLMKKKSINPLKTILIAAIMLGCLGYMVKCAIYCKRQVEALTEMKQHEVPTYQIK